VLVDNIINTKHQSRTALYRRINIANSGATSAKAKTKIAILKKISIFELI
jgi:hypothetical protein